MIADTLFLRNTGNGHFWLKSDKKHNNNRFSKRQTVGNIENTKPLIVTITHDKTTNWRQGTERRLQWGRKKEQYHPVPRIGSNNDVITEKARNRRLGPPGTSYGEGL